MDILIRILKKIALLKDTSGIFIFGDFFSEKLCNLAVGPKLPYKLDSQCPVLFFDVLEGCISISNFQPFDKGTIHDFYQNGQKMTILGTFWVQNIEFSTKNTFKDSFFRVFRRPEFIFQAPGTNGPI